MLSGSSLTKISIATYLGIKSLSDFILPLHCALCGVRTGRQGPVSRLCMPCTEQLWGATKGVARMACRVCALPMRTNQVCGACQRHPPAFAATFAAALYTPPFDQLLIGLKFRAQLAHANLFAELLERRILMMGWPDGQPPDLLVPVPLHRERLAERGFNQSAEIARLLGQRLGIPMRTDILLRIRPTPPQAQLILKARKANLRQAFAVPDHALPQIQGKRLALVDDVMTSGATLNELARTLRKAGAHEVINLVVARTP